MIGVDKIEDIRKRGRRGESIASILRQAGVSEPTVRKYLRAPDLSPEPPRRREPESELLEPFRASIDAWLDDDCRCWRKQRHTATRVYVRLRDELGYGGSYSTVQRYVRRRKAQMAEERDARDAQGYLRLSWLPGECQVDFGEADFKVRGVAQRGKYLTVSLPHANVGLTQVFWGETSECVCQGLRNVFEFLGGVPRRAVFDNATEVGGRVGDRVRVSGMFRMFAAHYGLDHSFTNPLPGQREGQRREQGRVPPQEPVRAGAGLPRRPRLQPQAAGGVPGHERRQAPLPPRRARARAVRGGPIGALAAAAGGLLVREVGDAQVQQAGSLHRRRPAPLLGGPAAAGREVAVALGAFEVTAVDAATGEALVSYERQWGAAPTDSSDPTLQLRLLRMRPAGWRVSVIRASPPAELVAFPDSEGAPDLARDLRVLRDESAERGWAAAVEGMSRSLAATGGVDRASVALSAARAAAGDARTEYEDDVDLTVYDGAFGLAEGGAA